MKFNFAANLRNGLRFGGLTLLLILAVLLSACGGDAATATTAPSGATPTAGGSSDGPTATAAPAAPTNTTVSVGGGSVVINGAGGTFPVPLYTKWYQQYSTSVDTSVSFNYQPIGSGAGITAITNKTVDFGASDAPLNDDQLKAAPNLIHIPTVSGAVVLIYNAPDLTGDLTLDADTVAGIFLGEITTWNDAKIAALNPGVTLPSSDIAVVHRSDGSGTSYIFTSYLSAVSDGWKSSAGTGTSVNWPVGLGGRGNAGVAGLVQQTPGSIGYVELAYATQNKIAFAKMKNAAGQVVTATVDSTVAAANGVTVPEDFRVSIVNSSDPAAWPIAGFTYLLIYKDLNNISDPAKATALMNYIWWTEHDGQALAADLLYAKAAPDLLTKIEAQLKAVTFNGAPVLK